MTVGELHISFFPNAGGSLMMVAGIWSSDRLFSEGGNSFSSKLEGRCISWMLTDGKH